MHGANGHPRVPYSCPTCRADVTRKPSEAFVVKTIVQLIADKTGEKNPHPPPQTATPARRSRSGKAKAPVPPSGPWDGFFGRA
ncbi:hypothetical protein PENSPDRAFT_587863 [Peniophora sp. CONT]|nr:hypothetical protein PENSPDRAFT_587863 [Peniophora sp. CONT]